VAGGGGLGGRVGWVRGGEGGGEVRGGGGKGKGGRGGGWGGGGGGARGIRALSVGEGKGSLFRRKVASGTLNHSMKKSKNGVRVLLGNAAPSPCVRGCVINSRIPAAPSA